jgi:hypothetical protein
VDLSLPLYLQASSKFEDRESARGHALSQNWETVALKFGWMLQVVYDYI